jgi:uncharacterized membrane protein (DUF106 family)
MRILLYAFLIYIAYSILVNFLIPIWKTTSKLKKGFREMNERMEAHQKEHQQQSAARSPKVESKPNANAEDYIDFEEVK